MANFIGGDVKEIVCNHPTLGDFRFQAKSNESFTIDPGGVRNNDDANAVTGNGGSIIQKNVVRWSLEGPIATDFKAGTHDDLIKLAEDPEEGVWTISHISGVIYKGKGQPVGDLQPDTNTAQMTLKVSGGGKLEKIS